NSFSCGFFTQPGASQGVAPLERPSKVRKAPSGTHEHALTLAAALATKLPDRVEEWTRTGLKAVTEEQRASIESFLASETQAAAESQSASESLDTVPPLVHSEEVDLNERPSRAQRGRRSFGGFLADTLSSQSRIRRRSESGSFLSPERCSPGKRWSFFRFSTQPGKSPARSDQSSLPSSPVREHDVIVPKPRKRAISDGGRRSEPVFSLSPIRTYASLPPPPEPPTAGRRSLTGASKAGLMDQPATGESQPGTPTLPDMPRVNTIRSKDLPPPWSAPNSPPAERPPWNAPNSPPPRWRGPKSPPSNPRPVKTSRASALTSSVPSKAPSPGASPRASVLRWSSFREPPAFTTPKTKDGFARQSGKRASDPPGEAVVTPGATRQNQSAPVSPRGKEGKSLWKSGEKARLSDKRKSGESAKGASPAAARVLSPPPKRTFSHETEDLLWAEQARKKGKLTSPVKTPGGEKRVGRTEERPQWNEPAWNRKAKQKQSLSPKKRYSKVRSASKSPVRMLSAKKGAKRKSNDLEQPLLTADDSFADGKLPNANESAGAEDLQLLGSAVKVAIDAIPGISAPENLPPVIPATEAENLSPRTLGFRSNTDDCPEAEDAESWEKTVETAFSGPEPEPEKETEPAEESPTPVSEQKRIRSPGMQMRADPRPMTSSGIRYENPLYDVTMTVSSDKMSDVITTAARFEQDRALEAIEEGAREGRRESGGIGRGGRPTSPVGFRLTAERSVNKPAESAEAGEYKPEASTDSAENWLTRKSLTPASSQKALSSNEETWLFAAEEEVPAAERNATWQQEGMAVTGGKLTVAEWLKQFAPEGSEGDGVAGDDSERGDAVAQKKVTAGNGHKEDATGEGWEVSDLVGVAKEIGSEGKERSSCSLFDGLLINDTSTGAKNEVVEANGYSVESPGNGAAEGDGSALRTEARVHTSEQERREEKNPQEANGLAAEWKPPEDNPLGEAQESESPNGALREFAGAGARRVRAEQGGDSLGWSQDEVMMTSVTWESLIREKQELTIEAAVPEAIAHPHFSEVCSSQDESEKSFQADDKTEQKGKPAEKEGERARSPVRKVGAGIEEQVAFFEAKASIAADVSPAKSQDIAVQNGHPKTGSVPGALAEFAEETAKKEGWQEKAAKEAGGTAAETESEDGENESGGEDDAKAVERHVSEAGPFDEAAGAELRGGAQKVPNGVSHLDGEESWEVVSERDFEEVLGETRLEVGEKGQEVGGSGANQTKDGGVGEGQSQGDEQGLLGDEAVTREERRLSTQGMILYLGKGEIDMSEVFSDEESEGQDEESPMRRGVLASGDEEMNGKWGPHGNERGSLSDPGLEVVKVAAENGEEVPAAAQKLPVQADGTEEPPAETDETEPPVALVQNGHHQLLDGPVGREELATALIPVRAAEIENGNGSGGGVAEESMLAVIGGGVNDGHVEGAEQGHAAERPEAQDEEEEDDVTSDAATGQGGGQSDFTDAENDDIPVSSNAMQSAWQESDMNMNLVASETEYWPDQEALPAAPQFAMFPPEPRKPPPHPAIQIAKVGGILAHAAVKTGVGMSYITLQQCGVLARVATGILIDDAKSVTGGLFKFTGRMLGFG
ncbi:hypothetical protein KFL_009320010, partial [Klebsormidium nitens]